MCISTYEGRLFCFEVMRSNPPNHDVLVFLVSLESSLNEKGAWALFHGVWTCGAIFFEY